MYIYCNEYKTTVYYILMFSFQILNKNDLDIENNFII